MSDAEELADRSRIRKQVKKVLKPLYDQRNDFTGCAIVILPVVVAFVGALQLDFSGWGAGGIAFVVLIVFAIIFGSREDKQKAVAADKTLDQFDQSFPHGDAGRLVAIDVLKQMAATEKYDFKEDASRLLQELGIEALPEQSADDTVDDALAEIDGNPAPQAAPKEPPAADTGPLKTPASSRRQDVVIQPEGTTKSAAPTPAVSTGGRRTRHIPLEPEDPDS